MIIYVDFKRKVILNKIDIDNNTKNKEVQKNNKKEDKIKSIDNNFQKIAKTIERLKKMIEEEEWR